MPHLSAPQAKGLALWSLGMVLARSCALTAVSVFLAQALGRKEDAVRQQLREWCYQSGDKRGHQRRDVNVQTCFVPLLAWIMHCWRGTQVALAMDATNLGDRFVVLAISVVYRGCAIPVCWKILPANAKGSWKREWMRMLRQMRPAIPATYTVIVLADRGLYARWLFRRIVRLGWHPYLRITSGNWFRPLGNKLYFPLSHYCPGPGSSWSGVGTAFKGRDTRLDCTLLAQWEEGHKEAWFILTDLPPAACDACWYGMRAWIEQGFKITKRAGWQWQRTRMTDPERAERLWLGVAIATYWMLSVGGEADLRIGEATIDDLSEILGIDRRQRRQTKLRLVSVFRRGLALILTGLLNGRLLLPGLLIPEPWPTSAALICTGQSLQTTVP
jgi:hypothetical protein